MEHYAGIDVSLESASICVVDASGRIVREAKVASEPEVLIRWFGGLGIALARIGLEAGPLSQWLYAGMRDVGLAVELLETRHVRAAFKAMPVKTDRKDARGIAAWTASSTRWRRIVGAAEATEKGVFLACRAGEHLCRPFSEVRSTLCWRKPDSNLYGAFPVK